MPTKQKLEENRLRRQQIDHEKELLERHAQQQRRRPIKEEVVTISEEPEKRNLQNVKI